MLKSSQSLEIPDEYKVLVAFALGYLANPKLCILIFRNLK